MEFVFDSKSCKQEELSKSLLRIIKRKKQRSNSKRFGMSFDGGFE